MTRRLLALLCSGLFFVSSATSARDVDGRYAQNEELHGWFEGLRSGKGNCCSDADGRVLSDVEWKSYGGHYIVYIPNNQGEMEWVDVPDDAVIKEKNRVGRTMVWPIRGYLGVSIRCFMPGAMI